MDGESKTYVALELVDAVLRSWWTIVAGACIGLTLATLVLHNSEPVYEATTKIFAESEKISRDYVRSTVIDNTRVRLAALKDEVLSRPYLESLIHETEGPEVYGGPDLERRMSEIRSNVGILYDRGARMFQISFTDRNPVEAARIANTLASLYIESNSKFRSNRAGQATSKLEELRDKAADELRQQEEAIAAYKAKNPNETEEQRAFNLEQLRSFRLDLQTNRKDQDALQDRLKMLHADLEIEQRVDQLTPGGAVVPDNVIDRLRAAETELEALRNRYADSHPAVKQKTREVDDLLAEAEAVDKVGEDPASPSPGISAKRAQIRIVEGQLARLIDAEQFLRQEQTRYERYLDRTPAIQQRIEELSKGLQAKEDQVERYRKQVEQAKGAQTLEEGDVGNPFEIIEPAVAPTEPIWPNPALILALGFVAGIALFVAPVLLKAILHPVLVSEAGVRDLAGDVPLLVSIPSIPSPDTDRRKRARTVRNWGLATVSAGILATVVATTGVPF